MSLFQKFTSFGNDFMSNKDMDVLDVKWVQNCRKKGKWKKPTTNHLKAYNWEILLVKDCSDYINAFAVPGGKIVVSSELLENFRSDDEIAAILGHEVAHILARHCAEKMTTYTWIERTICSLFGLGMHNFDKAKNESLAFLVEAEADYIGLLLMASAGYDPRVAPGFYKKLYEISGVGPGDPRYDDTGEKRARLLAEPKVMEEALLMYQDATRGCGD